MVAGRGCSWQFTVLKRGWQNHRHGTGLHKEKPQPFRHGQGLQGLWSGPCLLQSWGSKAPPLQMRADI